MLSVTLKIHIGEMMLLYMYISSMLVLDCLPYIVILHHFYIICNELKVCHIDQADLTQCSS